MHTALKRSQETTGMRLQGALRSPRAVKYGGLSGKCFVLHNRGLELLRGSKRFFYQLEASDFSTQWSGLRV